MTLHLEPCTSGVILDQIRSIHAYQQLLPQHLFKGKYIIYHILVVFHAVLQYSDDLISLYTSPKIEHDILESNVIEKDILAILVYKVLVKYTG